ncbi:MAG: hypothetical protein ABR879_08550 [Methanomassiliicoccales archaeon]
MVSHCRTVHKRGALTPTNDSEKDICTVTTTLEAINATVIGIVNSISRYRPRSGFRKVG